MRKQEVPEMKCTGSHFVTLPEYGNGLKEEVYLYFETEWRGQACTVTMRASRYEAGMDRTNLEWTEWRVYASDARAIDPEANGGRGAELTDLARSRLSTACQPLAEDWLKSDAYTASERQAFVSALKRVASDMKGYNNPPSSNLRTDLARYGHKVGPEAVAQLTLVADAFDAFHASLDAVQ